MSRIYVSNKSQLINAIKSLDYVDEAHVIINVRKNGGETRFCIIPNALRRTQEKFERDMQRLVKEIKRSPAHVWS